MTYPISNHEADYGLLADSLGRARAELDAARKRVEDLENALKLDHVEVAEGRHFRVRISYGVETKRPAWKAIAEHFNPSRQLVRAHTDVSYSDRVRVSALKK